MPRTLFSVSLLVLLLPGQSVLAGPPEGVSGRMALVGDEVRRDLRLRLKSGAEVLLQKTAEGVVVERPGVRYFSPRAFVDRVRGVLVLEGTAKNPVTISNQRGDLATATRCEVDLAP